MAMTRSIVVCMDADLALGVRGRAQRGQRLAPQRVQGLGQFAKRGGVEGAGDFVQRAGDRAAGLLDARDGPVEAPDRLVEAARGSR